MPKVQETTLTAIREKIKNDARKIAQIESNLRFPDETPKQITLFLDQESAKPAIPKRE